MLSINIAMAYSRDARGRGDTVRLDHATSHLAMTAAARQRRGNVPNASSITLERRHDHGANSEWTSVGAIRDLQNAWMPQALRIANQENAARYDFSGGFCSGIVEALISVGSAGHLLPA
jgi:hypothetical protein